jgi:phosphoglycerate-specific signal transduction histidine kinase
MMRLTDALAQPLTAASNYVGAARLFLLSTEANATAVAVENLEHAQVQIVRAGAIFRQFRERSA